MTGGGLLLLILTWMWEAPGQVDNATVWYQIISDHSPFIRGFGTIFAVILVIVALVLLRMPETEEKASTKEDGLPDAVQALEQRVKGIETKVESLMSSEQKEAAAQELSKHEPAGEVEVTSDVSVIDQAVEIVSVLEDAGWDAKTSSLDKGEEPPEGITVSGLASGILIDAFRHADLDIKEDATRKTGRTYIVIGPIKGKKKNDP